MDQQQRTINRREIVDGYQVIELEGEGNEEKGKENRTTSTCSYHSLPFVGGNWATL